jgi:hypothetical protein
MGEAMAADPYHMSRPDLAEAKDAVRRLYGYRADDMWQTLLGKAGLSGHESDPAAVERMAETMIAADPVLALCGRSLVIRYKTYEYLLAAAAVIEEAR